MGSGIQIAWQVKYDKAPAGVPDVSARVVLASNIHEALRIARSLDAPRAAYPYNYPALPIVSIEQVGYYRPERIDSEEATIQA